MLELFPQAEKFLTRLSKALHSEAFSAQELRAAASLLVITTPFYPRSRLSVNCLTLRIFLSRRREDRLSARSVIFTIPRSFEAFSSLRWTR